LTLHDDAATAAERSVSSELLSVQSVFHRARKLTTREASLKLPRDARLRIDGGGFYDKRFDG